MSKITVRLVYKLGGSLAITIPSKFCKENYITHGTIMICEEEGGEIKVKRANTINKDLGNKENSNRKEEKTAIKKHIITEKITQLKRQQQIKGAAKWESK